MPDRIENLRELAEQAARETYSPRAKKCWPWSHAWTMWETHRRPGWPYDVCQMRRCVRCGKFQTKDFD